jgi:hypothetical protein
MRASGERGLVVFCSDYRCSHNVELAPARAGLSHLNEGQKISFELKADRKTGKMNADNLRV